MIPEAAVEAAHKAWREQAKQDGTIFEYNLRAAIEAAVEVALSHEREETRLAHVDAVVNAQTVDRLEKTFDAISALHQRDVVAVHEGYGEEAWCPACAVPWPCRTADEIDSTIH